MEGKINILIADDHPAVRYGVRSILQLEPNLNIVGEASSGDEAINLLATIYADLVIVDLKDARKGWYRNGQKTPAVSPVTENTGFQYP